MLTTSDLIHALDFVRYKPNFVLEIDEPDIVQGPYLHVYIIVPDANDTDVEAKLRIHSPIPPMPTVTAFHNWLLWRLKMIEIHECMEFFHVDGKPYLDPHEPM